MEWPSRWKSTTDVWEEWSLCIHMSLVKYWTWVLMLVQSASLFIHMIKTTLQPTAAKAMLGLGKKHHKTFISSIRSWLALADVSRSWLQELTVWQRTRKKFINTPPTPTQTLIVNWQCGLGRCRSGSGSFLLLWNWNEHFWREPSAKIWNLPKCRKSAVDQVCQFDQMHNLRWIHWSCTALHLDVCYHRSVVLCYHHWGLK